MTAPPKHRRALDLARSRRKVFALNPNTMRFEVVTLRWWPDRQPLTIELTPELADQIQRTLEAMPMPPLPRQDRWSRESMSRKPWPLVDGIPWRWA